MSKTIVLHIGANKTGSSAIQAFLRANSGILPEFGITVAAADLAPGGAITGEHVWFIQAQLNAIETNALGMVDKIDANMAGLPDNSKLILSAENLSNRNNSHLLFSKLASKYNIEIILYIRRQDEYLLSSWQQWYSKTSDDFWAWLISAVGQIGNWQVCLEAWETIVSRQDIKVRVYERERLVDRDVNADFIEQLGLTAVRHRFKFPAGSINPSYSEAVLDLVKGNPAIFEGIHDNGFYNLVRDLTGDAFLKKSRESLLTLKQRLAIIQRFRGPNAWVKNAYFYNQPGELFATPAETDYAAISKDEIEAQKWKLVASLIYGLSKKDTMKKR